MPSLSDETYLETLLDAVRRHDIGLVVPTIDTELPQLAAHRGDFEALGAVVLISDTAFVEVCGDKARTAAVFGAHGIDVPRSWTLDELPGADLPEALFVKPRDGSSSKDIHHAARDSIADVVALVPNPIVQERLIGPEVTIDALLDLSGRPLHYVPRTRIKTLGGESIQGVTLPRADLGPWIEQVLGVCGGLGARGPITLQAFHTDRGPVLLEVNPRFGGGFPLTNAAGGRYPEWLLDVMVGKHPDAKLGDYREGLYMTRHMVEDFTDAPLW